MALLCILYLIILWRGVVIAFEARDSFGAFLAFGITLLITIQAGFNLCVVTGIAPTKGLTLPLVSYGRTSLMIVLACVGILLNISQRNPDLTKARSTAKEQQYLENTLRHTELRFRKLREEQSTRRRA
jgi:cell division protein FtsW